MQRSQRRADHYEWFSNFLRGRDATLALRFGIAGVSVSWTACVLALLTGAGGPRDQPGVALMWVAAAGGLWGAALWLWRWPTRAWSMSFAVVACASIAAACLVYPDPLAAMLGCVAFTSIGAYLAFFHTTRSVVWNVAVAAAVATWAFLRLSDAGRTALGAVDLWLILQINVAVPLAIGILWGALRGDLIQADHDPLTDLLNRRAFQRQTLDMIARRCQEHRYLVVALIDLDDFKTLNDTLGHSEGDRALVAVAGALRSTAGPTAVISRSGGEEFLIADLATTADDADDFEKVCAAIAGSPAPVTASIGTAYLPLQGLSQASMKTLINQLVAAADNAMYLAKRDGGNRCHDHGIWPSPAASA